MAKESFEKILDKSNERKNQKALLGSFSSRRVLPRLVHVISAEELESNLGPPELLFP